MRLCGAAFILAAISLVAGSAEAGSITYSGSQTYDDGGSATFSFTTDGTLGAIDASDFTAFSVDIKPAGGGPDVSFNNTDGQLLSEGNAFSETTNTLSYDFSDTVPIYTFQTNIGGYDINFENGREGYFYSFGLAVGGVSETGVVAIAQATPSISAAPEPDAWALMIAGVGLVGLAFCTARRRQEIATVA